MIAQQWDHSKEQELIQKYLDDSLTREEELLVADLYDKDPEFRDALDGLELISASEFTNSMDSINEKIDSKINSAANIINISTEKKEDSQTDSIGRDNVRTMYTHNRSMRRLAIAATFILCLALGGTILMNVVKSPTNLVFATNFEPKPYPDQITRGSGEDLSQPEKLAISAYNTENYEVSVKYFEDLYQQYPENEKYGLFLGISHMGMNEHSEAVIILENLQGDAGKYSEDVNWYLALSYLKTKNVEGAKELLTDLSDNSNSYYSEPSAEILKKLK